jgi:hypothetical protein
VKLACGHIVLSARPGAFAPDRCRVCWLYLTDAAHQALGDGREILVSAAPQPAIPSLVRRAANFGKAVVRHVAAGCPKVSEEEKVRRMALCLACEHWSQGRCTQCGCFTAAKTARAREKCPVGKW